MTHFARAIGAARSGKPADAAADIERLAALARLIEMKDAYWTEQVDIQRRVAEAWKMFAEGDKAKGVELLSAAADAEDLTDKSAVTPGPIAPARELLGFMLLDAGRAKEALVAFEDDDEGTEPVPRALRRRACGGSGRQQARGCGALRETARDGRRHVRQSAGAGACEADDGVAVATHRV